MPSSLTIGCTAYLSAELAPVPLLWVVPLAVYLLTFIISFTGHVIRPTNDIVGVTALMGLLLATMHIAGTATNAVGVVLHLGGLFLVCALCHGRLADSRPAPDHLTAFYLWTSVGGVVGGLFNALVAPALFNTSIEYPLMGRAWTTTRTAFCLRTPVHAFRCFSPTASPRQVDAK